MSIRVSCGVLACTGVVLTSAGHAQGDDASSLAQSLSNPIASLISVPFQINLDSNYGPDESGDVLKLNIQPVIPFSFNDDWNVISRTIVPVIDQDDFAFSTGGQSGIGDIAEAVFFSPKAPTSRGLIWGVGPQFLLPTATSDALGSDKWGLGPTAVFLRQQGGWTYGALIGHMVSVAGNDDRRDISLTNLQPFVSYVTSQAVTYGINFESSYNRKASSGQEWSVPLNLSISKLTRLGDQIISLQGGIRYWVDSPDNGPQDWGFRLQVTLLYPR